MRGSPDRPLVDLPQDPPPVGALEAVPGVAVFDLFGTLVRSVAPHEHADALARLAPFGLPEGFAEAFAASADERDSGTFGSLAGYFTHLGVGDPAAAASAWAAMSASWVSRVRPGAAALLTRLRACGWCTALCSNAGPEAGWALATGPLAGLFDRVVVSADHGCLKPDRELLAAAADGLADERAAGDVPPRKVVFVGDGGTDELAAAASLGWVPVQVPLLHGDGTESWRDLGDVFCGPRWFDDLGDVLVTAATLGTPVPFAPWCPEHLPPTMVPGGSARDLSCGRCGRPGASPGIPVLAPQPPL